jgi:hypothetical protein
MESNDQLKRNQLMHFLRGGVVGVDLLVVNGSRPDDGLDKCTSGMDSLRVDAMNAQCC